MLKNRKQLQESIDDKTNSVEEVLNLGHMVRLLMGKKKATRYNEKADASSEQFNKKCR